MPLHALVDLRAYFGVVIVLSLCFGGHRLAPSRALSHPALLQTSGHSVHHAFSVNLISSFKNSLPSRISK